MLGDKRVTATIAVKDLEASRKFYKDVLGLSEAGGEDMGGILFNSGDCQVFVYESKFAGTNQATTAAWNVGDELETIVEDLKSKGVSFEHYDMPDVELKGDIHIMGDFKCVWFKDPDGNILNVINKA